MVRHFKALFFIALSVLSLQADFLDKESAQALKENKLILVNIESEDCPYCQKMKKEIFNARAYRKKIDQHFIVVTYLNSDPILPADFRPQYVPANAIYSPKKRDILDAYIGYIEPARFMEILDNTYEVEFKH